MQSASVYGSGVITINRGWKEIWRGVRFAIESWKLDRKSDGSYRVIINAIVDIKP